MSTLEELEKYLVGEDGYLLNDDNNGKTVMLSGAWGSGKTHFWQKAIETDLTEKLNDKSKACVYVSLYGKDNIEAIKNEILFKAYESVKDENKLAKRAISAFGFGSRLLSISVGGVRANTGAAGEAVEGFFENKKIDEAESFLADGGLICLDDFERKSKHIDLNDLFGFIAQLAIDMNCKIVIILNSDVFEGEEASVFKMVKEKTVNKFFYFRPSPEELFESIYGSNDKYKKLDSYKREILNAIQETEELNARIYIQVLDNCLEWIDGKYDESVLRVLVFVSIYFIKTNNVIKYAYVNFEGSTAEYSIHHILGTKYPLGVIQALSNSSSKPKTGHRRSGYNELEEYVLVDNERYLEELKTTSPEGIFSNMENYILKHKEYSDIERKIYIDFLYENEMEIMEFWRYGYKLFFMEGLDETYYSSILNFIRTGILPKKEDNI